MIRCHNVRARKGERERGRENEKNHHPPHDLCSSGDDGCCGMYVQIHVEITRILSRFLRSLR